MFLHIFFKIFMIFANHFQTEDPVPLPLDVGENLEPGTEVGSVAVARDDDAPGNDIIFYFIVGKSCHWADPGRRYHNGN